MTDLYKQPQLNSEYYLQDSREYVGNDILWWATNCSGYTTNLLNAHVFTKKAAIKKHNSRTTDIPWPKKYIDQKIRPAVDMQYVKIKEALKGTGIKLVKPKRKRPTTGKTRYNCFSCGKIVWDSVPHVAYYLCVSCERY